MGVLFWPERRRTCNGEQKVTVEELSSVEVCPVKGVAGQTVYLDSSDKHVSVTG